MTDRITHVCPNCFEDRAFKVRIRELAGTGSKGWCSLHKSSDGVDYRVVADFVGRTFRRHYALSDHYDPQRNEYFGEGMDEIVERLTGAIDQNLTELICRYLLDQDELDAGPDGVFSFFSDSAAYVRAFNGHVAQSRWWQDFRRSIQYDRRFFNSEAKDLLAHIFKNVHLLLDVDRRSPLVTLKRDETILYRARIIGSGQDEGQIIDDPSGQLGPPPEVLRRQGRMNAAGILAFYGAFDPATCVAELRPPVGSRVAWAVFEVARPLVLLDLTRFQGAPKDRNLFSTYADDRMSQWLFMQQFMTEISAPILPGDEVFEYIPTQVVAEYLVRHHNFGRGKATKFIDGLVYHSAQRAGEGQAARDVRNVVLFGDAAMVEGANSERERPLGSGKSPWSTIPKTALKPGLRYRPDSLRIRKVSGVEVALGSVVDPNDPEEPERYYQ